MISGQKMSTGFTIGELARRSGVTTSTLRFYEERGLISSERNASGHRRFPGRRRAGWRTSSLHSGLTSPRMRSGPSLRNFQTTGFRGSRIGIA